MLDHVTAFTVDSNAAFAGEIIGDSNYALATWIAGDHIVALSGRMPVSQLIDTARTVHTVDAAEWRGMQFQARHNETESSAYHPYHESNSTPVSFGTDAAGNDWTISVSVGNDGVQRQINWFWGVNSGGYSTQPSDTAQINTFVDDHRTYVLADLPRAVAATAELRVDRPGADTVTVQFVDTDATLDRTFAAYAFSESGPYSAQIVAPDGSILATWPSS
jgi:hypothetical protein